MRKKRIISTLFILFIFKTLAFSVWYDFLWQFDEFSNNVGDSIGSVSNNWSDVSNSPNIILSNSPNGSISIARMSPNPFSDDAVAIAEIPDVDIGCIYEFQASFFADDPSANTLSNTQLIFLNSDEKKVFSIGISPQGQIGLLIYNNDSISGGYTWSSSQQHWDCLKITYTVVEGLGNDKILVSYQGYAQEPWIDSPEGELVLFHDLSLDQQNQIEARIHPEHTGNYSYIDDISGTIIPEPATLLLLGLGTITLRKRKF